MSESLPELSADIRRLPLEERMRRARALMERIEREGPVPGLANLTMEDIVQAVKRTREEMARERIASRP